MNYDDIFGDDIFEEAFIDYNNVRDDLNTIYDKHGFDKQLTMLSLKSCDLVALNSIYSQLESESDKVDCKKKIVNSMGTIYSIIETFLASDEAIFEAMVLAQKQYINHELNAKPLKSKNSEEGIVKNNRIAYLFDNGKGN